MRIEVEKLTVRRGPRQVLTDVSLTAGPGAIVTIVGPNGAGKTTLLLSILRLLPVVSGQVRLDGERTTHLATKRIAQRLAFVPQSYDGFLGFRVRDIIETGRYAHRDPLAPLNADDEHAIETAIDQCGVRPFLDRTADALSAGERQKVFLAAALAQASPALLLDEPTNALDPRHQVELIRLLAQLAAAGKTLLIVCHDLQVPALLGAQIVAIKAGRVAFTGPCRDFLTPQQLESLYETEFSVQPSADLGHPIVQLKV